MSKAKIDRPELFFCLVGPVGVDLEGVYSVVSQQLELYGYKPKLINITDVIPVIVPGGAVKYGSLYERYNDLITKSNSLREAFGNAIMADLALFLIRGARSEFTRSPDKAAEGVAYIVRQLKRTEEIQRFREVYGKQVFQISAYADPELRKVRLAKKMRDHDTSETRVDHFEPKALELLNRDQYEDALPYGQRVRDVFPLGDVFIDATSNETIASTMQRFMKIVFGYNFHSPTRDEYGMYIAKSASLRSVDLSRQVGAAVFSKKGEVQVMGCNEVPSPSGGTYWEGDIGDTREFTIGVDTNDEFKHRLLSDVLKNFAKIGIIDKRYGAMRSLDFLNEVKTSHSVDLDKSLLMMDIIEYGRIIHAEMNAITDAARNGIRLDGTTLFCTTFPCHLCAKHIISSGINRVVYIEPYPKSYTTDLYRDDIILRRATAGSDPGKVHFEPFIGVAPHRYRDLFEKSKRKDTEGKAKIWREGAPMPIVEISTAEYVVVEKEYLTALTSQFAAKGVMLPDGKIYGDVPSVSDSG